MNYEEAMEVRRKAVELQQQMPDLIVEARKTKPAAQIARDLLVTESYVHQILRRSKRG